MFSYTNSGELLRPGSNPLIPQIRREPALGHARQHADVQRRSRGRRLGDRADRHGRLKCLVLWVPRWWGSELHGLGPARHRVHSVESGRLHLLRLEWHLLRTAGLQPGQLCRNSHRHRHIRSRLCADRGDGGVILAVEPGGDARPSACGPPPIPCASLGCSGIRRRVAPAEIRGALVACRRALDPLAACADEDRDAGLPPWSPPVPGRGPGGQLRRSRPRDSCLRSGIAADKPRSESFRTCHERLVRAADSTRSGAFSCHLALRYCRLTHRRRPGGASPTRRSTATPLERVARAEGHDGGVT